MGGGFSREDVLLIPKLLGTLATMQTRRTAGEWGAAWGPKLTNSDEIRATVRC